MAKSNNKFDKLGGLEILAGGHQKEYNQFKRDYDTGVFLEEALNADLKDSKSIEDFKNLFLASQNTAPSGGSDPLTDTSDVSNKNDNSVGAQIEAKWGSQEEQNRALEYEKQLQQQKEAEKYAPENDIEAMTMESFQDQGKVKQYKDEKARLKELKKKTYTGLFEEEVEGVRKTLGVDFKDKNRGFLKRAYDDVVGGVLAPLGALAGGGVIKAAGELGITQRGNMSSEEAREYDYLDSKINNMEKPAKKEYLKKIEAEEQQAFQSAGFKNVADAQQQYYNASGPYWDKRRSEGASDGEIYRELDEFNDISYMYSKNKDMIKTGMRDMKFGTAIWEGAIKNADEKLTFGISGLTSKIKAANIFDKIQNKEQLTPSEQMFANAFIAQQETDEKGVISDSNYDLGDSVAHSAVFMGELYATGGVAGAVANSLKTAGVVAGKGFLSSALRTAITSGEYLTTAGLQPSTYTHALDKMNSSAQRTGDKENPFLVTDGDKLDWAKKTKGLIGEKKTELNRLLKQLEQAQINDPEGDHTDLYNAIDRVQKQRYGLEDKLAGIVDEDGDVIKKEVSLGKALAAGFWNNIVENYSERIIGGKVDDLTQSAKRAIGANKTVNKIADKTGLNYVGGKLDKANDFLQRTRVNLDRNLSGSDLGLLSKSFVRGTSGAKLFHSLPSEMVEEIFVQLTPKIEEDYAKALEELTDTDFYTQVALSTLMLGGGGQIVGNLKNGLSYTFDKKYRAGVKDQALQLNQARDLYNKIEKATTDKDIAEEIAMHTVGTVFQYNEYQNKINDLRDLEKPDPLNRTPEEREEAAKNLEKTSLYNMAYQAASLGSEKEFKKALKIMQEKEDISDEMKANATEAMEIVDSFSKMKENYIGQINAPSLYQYDSNAKLFERTARILEEKAFDTGGETKLAEIEKAYREENGFDDTYSILDASQEKLFKDEGFQNYVAGFESFNKDADVKKYIEYKFNAKSALAEAKKNKEKLAWELDPKNAKEIKKREDDLARKRADAAKTAEEAEKIAKEAGLEDDPEIQNKINDKHIAESTRIFGVEEYQKDINNTEVLQKTFTPSTPIPAEVVSESTNILNDTVAIQQMANEASGIESPKSEDTPESINNIVNKRFLDTLSDTESDDINPTYLENKEQVDEQVKQLIDYFKSLEGKESLTTDEKTSFANAIIVNKGIVPTGLTNLYLKHKVDIDKAYQESKGMFEKIDAVEKEMQEFKDTHTTPSKIYNQSKIEAKKDKKSIYYKASKIVEKYKGPEYSIKITSKNGKALIDLGVTPNEKGIITRAELEPFVRESLKSVYKPLFEKETKKIIKKDDYQKAITNYLRKIQEIKEAYTPKLSEVIENSIQDKVSEVTSEVIEEAKEEKKEEIEQTLNNPETLSEKQEKALDTLIEEETTEEVKAIAEEEIANEETTEEEVTPEIATNSYIKSKFKQFLKGKYAGKLSSFFGKLKTKFRQILFGITIASSLGSFIIESTTQNYIDLSENKIENIEIKPTVITNKYEAKTEDYKYGVENYYTENYARDENDNKKENKPSAIVLHHTGEFVRGEQGTLSLFQEKDGNSAHFVIGKDGKLYQLNDTSYIMHHAGKSLFKGKEAVNTHSIGIEIQGDSGKADFTKEQYETLITLVNHLSKELGIKFEDIVDHKTIRDNYIEAHPDEKEVYRKRDMDEEVMKHLTSEIQKVYEQYPEAKEVLQKIEKGEPVEDGLPLSVYLGLLAALQGISLGVSKYRNNKNNKKVEEESEEENTAKETIKQQSSEDFIKALQLDTKALESMQMQESLEEEVSKEENLTEEVKEEETQEEIKEEVKEEKPKRERPPLTKINLGGGGDYVIPKKDRRKLPNSPILEEVQQEVVEKKAAEEQEEVKTTTKKGKKKPPAFPSSNKSAENFENDPKVKAQLNRLRKGLMAIPRNPNSQIQNDFIARLTADIKNNVLPNYPYIDLDTYITSLVTALGSTKVVEQNFQLIVEAFEKAKGTKLPQGDIDHIYKMQFNPITGISDLSIFGISTGVDNSANSQQAVTPVEIAKQENKNETIVQEPRVDGTTITQELAPHTDRLYADIGLKFGGILGKNYTTVNGIKTDATTVVNEEAKPFMDWRNFSEGSPIELKFNLEYAKNPDSITSVWKNQSNLNLDGTSKPVRVRMTMKERLFKGKGDIEPIFKNHPTIKNWNDYVAELEKFEKDPKSTSIFSESMELLEIMPVGTVNNGFVGPQENGTIPAIIPGALNDTQWFNNSNVALKLTKDGTPMLDEREERIQKNREINLKARMAIAFNGNFKTQISEYRDVATNVLLLLETEEEQGYSNSFQSIFSQFGKNVEEFNKNAGLAYLNNKFVLIGSNPKSDKKGEPLVIDGKTIDKSQIKNWKSFAEQVLDSKHTNGRTVLVHKSGINEDGKDIFTIRNVITNHQRKQSQYKSLSSLIDSIYFELTDNDKDTDKVRKEKANLRQLFKERFGYELSQQTKDLIALAYPHHNDKAGEDYRSDFVAKALNLKEVPDLSPFIMKGKSVKDFIKALKDGSITKTTPLEVMLRGIHTNVVFTPITKNGETIYTSGSQPVGMLSMGGLQGIELPKIQKKEADPEINSGIVNENNSNNNFPTEEEQLKSLDSDITRIQKKIDFNKKGLQEIPANEEAAIQATKEEIANLEQELTKLQNEREALVGTTVGQIGGDASGQTEDIQTSTKIANVSAALEDDIELKTLAETTLSLDSAEELQENFTNFVDNYVHLNFDWLVANLEDLGEVEKECK